MYISDRAQSFSELDLETKQEEERLQSYFMSRGYKVTEKRDCEEARLKDIDFEIEMHGVIKNIEVKADKQMHRTGNIMVEISHDRPHKGKTNGWFKYCEADVICYSDVVNNKGYMLDWKKMKAKETKLNEDFKIIGFNNPHDIGTRTFAFLIPVSEAKEQGFIIEEYFHN